MSPKPVLPPDIELLRHYLDEGEGDDVLVEQAIRIKQRLTRDMNAAGSRKEDAPKREKIKAENVEFRRVLDEIRLRRHTGVLDKYDQYLYRIRKRHP